MWILVLGLAIFFAVHSVRMVAGNFRDVQLAANERRWKGVYSLLSLLGFGLIIWGWIAFRAEAPQVYTPPDWAGTRPGPSCWSHSSCCRHRRCRRDISSAG